MSEYAPFEWQRRMLDLAKEHGWEGDIPSVLGSHRANKQVSRAVSFLYERNLITMDGVGVGLAEVSPKP